MLPFAWKIFIWEMILFTCLYFTNRTHLSPLRGLSKQDVSFSQVAPINTFSVSDDVRIICRWRNGRLLLPCGKHWNGGLNHILIPLSQYCFKGIGCKSLQKYFFSLSVFFFFMCPECGSGDPIWGFPNGSIPNRCMFQPSFLFNKEGIFLEVCRTKLLDFWGSKWPEKRLSFLLQMLWAVWLTKKKQERGWKQTNKKKKNLSKKAAYGNAVLFLEPAYSFISLERYSQNPVPETTLALRNARLRRHRWPLCRGTLDTSRSVAVSAGSCT